MLTRGIEPGMAHLSIKFVVAPLLKMPDLLERWACNPLHRDTFEGGGGKYSTWTRKDLIRAWCLQAKLVLPPCTYRSGKEGDAARAYRMWEGAEGVNALPATRKAL